ncbi:MAG: hypothetical protein K0U68_01760 [Gammaproteobacteria bacterium]|nr:hypothetical protein [Gammaproteobacteria bacterium]
MIQLRNVHGIIAQIIPCTFLIHLLPDNGVIVVLECSDFDMLTFAKQQRLVPGHNLNTPNSYNLFFPGMNRSGRFSMNQLNKCA